MTVTEITKKTKELKCYMDTMQIKSALTSARVLKKHLYAIDTKIRQFKS